MRNRIFIIDDNPFVRETMTRVLTENNFTVVGEADNVKDGLWKAKALRPDLAVVDLSINDESDGLYLIRSLRFDGHRFPILVWSVYEETDYADQVLWAGAQGYLMKQEPVSKFLDAVRSVLAGETYLTDRFQTHKRKVEAL